MLREYADDIDEIVAEETKSIIKQAKQELVQKSPKKTGKYAKSWTISVKKNNKANVFSKIIYNKKYYRLTHLFEFGFYPRNGTTFAEPRPHIREVENKFNNLLSENIERKIKR